MRATAKFAGVGALLLAGVLAVSGCGADTAAGSSDEVVVGVALPLTGGSAILGEPMSHGIELAVKQINEDGGIDGKKVRIAREDIGPDNESALNAFNRLLNEDPVAVIGFPVSTQGFAIMTQVDRAGIPVIMGGTNSKLAAGSKLAFNMTTHDGVATAAAVEYAAKKLGVTKIALLRESGELGTGGSEVVHASAKKNGIDVVAEEIFQSGDVDLATQATNLRNSDAQMLFIFGQQADFITASNALATAGVDMRVFASGLQPKTYQDMTLGSLGTVYVRNQCVPTAAKSGPLADWTKVYTDEFGTAPSEYAAIAYDGFELLKTAIKGSDGDPAKVADALANLPDTKGICGVHRGGPDGNLSFGVTLGHYEGDNYVVDYETSVD